MTARIFHSVLPFAIRVIRGRADHLYTRLFHMVVMIIDISDPNHDREGSIGFGSPLSHYKRPFAEGKLSTVVPDPQALFEPKRAAEPIRRLAHIRVGKFRNDHRRRHGTISSHYSSSLNLVAKCPDHFTGCNLCD